MKLNIRATGMKNTHPILIGLLYTYAIAIVGALIFTLLLYWTSISDAKIPLVSYVITAVSLMIGGYITGRRAGERGWYYGGLMGIIYGIILVFIVFLAFNAPINLRSLVLLLLTFLFGAFVGIIGVNRNK